MRCALGHNHYHPALGRHVICPNCFGEIPDNSRDCLRCGVNFTRWASGGTAPRAGQRAGRERAPSRSVTAATQGGSSSARRGPAVSLRRRLLELAGALVAAWLTWWSLAPVLDRLLVGGTVVFVSSQHGNPELYALSPGARSARRLTNHPALDHSPSLSRDGRRVAFVSYRDGAASIYVVGLDGTGPTRLAVAGGRPLQPVWSPTGNELALVFEPETPEGSGRTEVLVASADGSRVVNVSQHQAAADAQPAWSPGGTRLALVSDRDGRERIFTVMADGSGLAPLTSRTAPESSPAWSPDGNRIAFVSEGDVVVCRADGSELQRLTSGAQETPRASYAQPTWSPDLTRLAAFRSLERDGRRTLEVAVLRGDGSGVEQSAAAEPGGLAWPDADRLFFIARPDAGRTWFAIQRFSGAPQVCLRSLRRAARAGTHTLDRLTARLFAPLSGAPPVDPALTVLTESGAEALDWAPGANPSP